MANKRPRPEAIVVKLRQVVVLTGQDLPRIGAISVTEHILIAGRRRSTVEWAQNTQRTETLTERERTPPSRSFESVVGQADFIGNPPGKLLSPSRRPACIDLVRRKVNVSKHRVCRVLGQHLSTQRRLPQGRADEEAIIPMDQRPILH